MPPRKIRPPDKNKDETRRIEFRAPKEVRDAFHAFRNKYDYKNFADALEHLLRAAEQYPNLFAKVTF